jgi:hypothetical protein
MRRESSPVGDHHDFLPSMVERLKGLKVQELKKMKGFKSAILPATFQPFTPSTFSQGERELGFE